MNISLFDFESLQEKYLELEQELNKHKELLKESIGVIEFYGDWMNWQGSLPEYTEILETDKEWLSNKTHPGTWKTDQRYRKGGKKARSFLDKPEIKESLNNLHQSQKD